MSDELAAARRVQGASAVLYNGMLANNNKYYVNIVTKCKQLVQNMANGTILSKDYLYFTPAMISPLYQCIIYDKNQLLENLFRVGSGNNVLVHKKICFTSIIKIQNYPAIFRHLIVTNNEKDQNTIHSISTVQSLRYTIISNLCILRSM
jgi:hypothetical protein